MATRRNDERDINRETAIRTNTGAPGRAEKLRTDRDEKGDANRDPITGTPGAHPVGTGAGAAAAGVAGGLIGSVAGPIGTAIGAGLGAIAGGLAGKGVAEAVNPTEEDAYWRENHTTRTYVSDAGMQSRTYDMDYAPAYRYGWESCCNNLPAGRSFDQAEPDLAREWDSHRGQSTLGWMEARPAARDAWDRVEGRVHQRLHRDDTI